MNVVTLASVRGAPGVTTASLLLASTLADGLVVEADLDGGVLAIRYGLGREPGLTTFAAAGPDDGSGWRAHAQDAGGVPVLVGPDAPSSSVALWRTAGERITRELVASDGVAVVDAGRLRSPSPVVAASDLLVILVQPVAEQPWRSLTSYRCCPQSVGRPESFSSETGLTAVPMSSARSE